MTAEKKTRLTRPTKPDRSQLDTQVAKLKEQISKCHDKMKSYKAKIDTIKEGRKGQGSATAEPRNKLIAIRTELKGLFEEQNGVRNQLKALNAQKDAIREQQKAIRAKCQYVKTEDIDAAIDKLENNMAHTSMTLNEEKKIIAQISELRKSKAMVKELLESSGGKVDPAARETLEAQLKSVGAKITELKAQEQEQRKIMDEIKAKMGETKDEVPDLIKQKNNQWEIVKRCKETIGNLWDEHRKVENEYWTKEKAWRAQAKEERQKKWEAEQEERKKRDIERKQRQLDEAGEPFDREVTTCEQLTSYLKSLTKEETKVEETKSAPKVEEGMVVLKKKNDESEMDSWFTGSKGKKKGGKKKAAKSDKLVHSMDIISSFATLGLTAPPSKDAKGISDLVDKLEAKKAEYLEKRKDAHVKRAAQKEKIAKELEAATNGTEEKAEEKANGEANGEANGKEEEKEEEEKKEGEEKKPEPAEDAGATPAEEETPAEESS